MWWLQKTAGTSACLYFTTAESFVFFPAWWPHFDSGWWENRRDRVCQCPGCIWIKIELLITSLGLAFCPSCELWNVIAVVRYTINSRGVGAFADSRRGSFCFYLRIPKSGSFYLPGCTQKPVWLAGSSPEKFVRWRLLQRHPFFYSSNSNTPKRRSSSASPRAWIWKHFLSLSVACVSHFFALSLSSPFFFFFYIHTF